MTLFLLCFWNNKGIGVFSLAQSLFLTICALWFFHTWFHTALQVPTPSESPYTQKKARYLKRFPICPYQMKSLNERTKKMIVGGFIAFIMIASVFVVTLDYFFSPSNKLEYNGFIFRPGNNEFISEINGKTYSFLFFPGDLEFINVPEKAKEILRAEVLTISYNPAGELSPALATAQFYFEEQLDGVKIIDRAVLNSSGLSLQQKSCANATVTQPVIELYEGNSSNIVASDNCIKINGVSPSDIMQLSERIVYQVLGVMK